MFAYPYGALITGVLLIVAGACTLARHLLLSPDTLDYPKAPWWLRLPMFAFAAVLVFLGLRFVWTFIGGAPDLIPPQPSPATQLLALVLVAYKAAMLINILRQRYSPATWARLNHITDLLACSKRPGGDRL